MMAVFEKILELLDNNHIKFSVFEHEPVFTSVEAAKVRDDAKLKQGAKALIMLADTKPIMIVLPGSHRVNSKLFKQLFSIKDLRMATPEEVKSITGVEIGAIPPLGNLFSLPVYMDKELGYSDTIFFNPGRHDRSIKMRYTDLISVVNPTLGQFAFLPNGQKENL